MGRGLFVGLRQISVGPSDFEKAGLKAEFGGLLVVTPIILLDNFLITAYFANMTDITE